MQDNKRTTPSRRLHAASILSWLFSLSIPSSSSAWVLNANDRGRRVGRRFSPFGAPDPRWHCRCRRPRSRDLDILAMTMPMPSSVDGISEIMQELASEAASTAATLAASPEEEAAMLTDLANLSSDLVILSAPETIVLRLSAVFEKILELYSDYLPEHAIRDNEFWLNVPVMAASLFLLFRSGWPMLGAQFVELNDDGTDLAAYELCFRPVGVTMLQFKSMKGAGCFEWISCEPGRVLIDEDKFDVPSLREDYDGSSEGGDDDNGKKVRPPTDWRNLYWQYNGEVVRSFKGKAFGSIERSNGMHIDNPEAQGLLGDTRFLYNLEREKNQQQPQHILRRFNNEDGIGRSDDNGYGDDYQLLHPIATITIGQTGAKLLRIDCHKLYDLMDHDSGLESSIRALLLKSLKLKISNLLFALQDERYDRNGSSSYVAVGHDNDVMTDHSGVKEDEKQQEMTTKPPI